ncbi:hypothetical protein EG68_08822 [Paragonimus skrjabini miyazakii]|uniref:Uncharacterized protein n=1 Tax=Paragonimus skrjabini miyazakii TaxID=59628 RepID=A0A8S9YPF7_9TREM|nr:hypothetical protein EG68_08822 [Paragonimus skrjabini miyazakii]
MILAVLIVMLFGPNISTSMLLRRSDNAPSIIDSLVISSEHNLPHHSQLPNPSKVGSLPPSNPQPASQSGEINKGSIYPTLNNRILSDTRDLLNEENCPLVQCFVWRNATDNKTTLDCGNRLPNNLDIVDQIDCRYWKNPTTGTNVPTASVQAMTDGRGFDLKVVLSPSSKTSTTTDGERRIHVDQLSVGILGWVIGSVRRSLRMDLSPAHLTISFIYIGKLRRVDLGDLSTRSHVTRLSLWNPFEWEDDSLMPTVLGSGIPGYAFPINPLIPPYFRLAIFCDHANRNPSFRRLWFPWASWQVRLNHCYDLYACREWNSKYPICDHNSSRAFRPSYFLLPQTISEGLASTTRVLALGSSQRAKVSTQILYENVCQREPNPTDPLHDLKLNHKLKCWQPDAYSVDNIKKGEVDTVDSVILFAESSKFNTSPSPTLSSSPRPTTLLTIATVNVSKVHIQTTTTTPKITRTTEVFYEPTNLTTEPLSSISNTPNMTKEFLQKPTPSTGNKSSETLIKSLTANDLLGLSYGDDDSLSGRLTNISSSIRPSIQANNISSIKKISNPIYKASVTQLTYAVVVLALLVTILIITLIVLLLWLKFRKQTTKKMRPCKVPSDGYFSRSDLSVADDLPSAGYPHLFKRKPVSSSTTRQTSLESTPQLAPYTSIMKTNGLNHPISPIKRNACSSNSDNKSGAHLTFGGHPPHCRSSNRCRDTYGQHMSATNLVGLHTETSFARYPWSHLDRIKACSQNSLRSRSRVPSNSPSPRRSSRTGSRNRVREQDCSPAVYRRLHRPKNVKQSKKPHTIVFEDSQLTEDQWPEGLRRSFSKIIPTVTAEPSSSNS